MTTLTDLLDEGHADGVAPALAGACGTPGVHRFGFAGHLGQDGQQGVYTGAESVFDLASLTKVLSTTLLSAMAVADGRLALDEQPWPGWPGVTVRHVLAHRAGLPGWRPLFEEAMSRRQVGLLPGRRTVVDAAQAVVPDARPDAHTLYSDIGFIALGALLEDRFGERLDRVFDDAARAAYGETTLRYVPIFEQGYVPRISACAPTERCGWRGRVMRGQVHDDNCFAMGGIAGHAGLFGTLGDVQRATCALLDVVCGRRTDAAWTDVLREFAAAPGERGLGFDRPTPGGSTGDVLSAAGVGHLGFTGTSLWLDGQSEVGPAYFVLLTNRVHPTRDNDKIRAFRRVFHHGAMAVLKEVA